MDEIKGFSSQMREHFKRLGKTDEEITALEGGLANKGQAARAAGIESKETTLDAEAATETPAPPNYVTAEEVAGVLTSMLQPLTVAVQTLTEALTTQQAEIKALRETDETKIAKAAAATPRASLQELMAMSIFGASGAQVDGRTTLAKAGPKQTAAPVEQATGIEYIDQMIAQSRAGVGQ